MFSSFVISKTREKFFLLQQRSNSKKRTKMLLSKQYRRRDGDVTPEKIDIDEELERQYSRANRAKSSEDEKKRLEKARDMRKEEREKGILLFNRTLK